jgi:cell division protein FtsI/penicillin-binding protein 2
MEIRLAKTAGFCFGVDRAVKLTYGLLDEGRKVATLGPLIHNPQTVEDLERRGALVALDPRNGEVLAFVSKPTFDPNLFVDGIDVDNWRMLNESLDKPLLNRALRGTYPPGSTYKPFMGLAALASGKRTAQTITNDPGYWMFGNHRFRSHGDAGLGSVDLYRSVLTLQPVLRI